MVQGLRKKKKRESDAKIKLKELSKALNLMAKTTDTCMFAAKILRPVCILGRKWRIHLKENPAACN